MAAGRRVVPDHVSAVLDIVIQRSIDVGDLAETQRHASDPVVVKRVTDGWRERKNILEKLSPEQ
jgi:hypothetical protein